MSFSFFNAKWYLDQNRDVAAAVAAGQTTAGVHFQQHGNQEGRAPGPLFNPAFYLTNNRDVRAAVEAIEITAYDHFTRFGVTEGRSPLFVFDDAFYLSQNPDVKAAVEAGQTTAVEHFATFGQSELRSFTPSLDLRAYLNANPDVKAAVEDGQMSALDHLVTYGLSEGRNLGNGVNLAIFRDDPVYQGALASGNADAALARVDSLAPFIPGFKRPQGWKPAENTPIPLDMNPADGSKLRVPDDIKVPGNVTLPQWFENARPVPEPDPGPAPGPTFSVVSDGSGNWFITGTVTVAKTGSDTETKYVFSSTSGTPVEVLASAVTGHLVIDGKLSGAAAVLDEVEVIGSGAVVVTDLKNTVAADLSKIKVTGSKTTEVTEDVTLTTANLGEFTISVGAGKTLTGPASVLGGKTIAGAGSVSLTGVAGDVDVTKITATGTLTIEGSGDGDTLGFGAVSRPLVIKGEAGDDTITAGSGGSVIRGGAGNDTLTGGNGKDVFKFEESFDRNGFDTISGFENGTGKDVLNFNAFLSAEKGSVFLDGSGKPTVFNTEDTLSGGEQPQIVNKLALVSVADIEVITEDTVKSWFGPDAYSNIFAESPPGEYKTILVVGEMSEATEVDGVKVYYAYDSDGTPESPTPNIGGFVVNLVATLSGINLTGFQTGNFSFDLV